MGILVPYDFPMSLLANREERLVVESLRDGLTDGWLIMPNVGLTDRRRADRRPLRDLMANTSFAAFLRDRPSQ